MRKAIAFWGLLFIATCSCNDGEVLFTDIQRVVEVDLQFSNERQDSQGDFEVSETTDIVSDEFTEYLNQIRDFGVNELTIELHLMDTTPSQPRIVFDRLSLSLNSIEPGGPGVDMFELTDVTLTDRVVSLTIFRSDVQATPETNNAISFVRSRLLREEAFSWDLNGNIEGLNDGALIDVKLLLDLTAEVVLP